MDAGRSNAEVGEEPSEGAAADGRFDDLNAKLAEVARSIYGEKAELLVVAPTSIRLLKKNARYMKKATFDQLAGNVRTDGMLSSVPLCHRLADGALECLSGNHRVKAAIKASLEGILIIVVPEQDGSRKVSTQLSHNALVGEDDKQLLADLWASMDGLEHKLYSGLDSQTIQELEKLNFQSFTAEPIRSERIILWFLPEEVDDLNKLLDSLHEAGLSDPIYTAPLAKFDKLFQALVRVKRIKQIKNTALAFSKLIDLVHEAAAQLKEEAKAEHETE